MPSVIEQGDIFGRIGKAIGEGSGEQIKANRIGNALKPEEGKPFNPLDTTQRMIRAGASPQEISQYLPLIQDQQARNEAFPQAQPANGNVAPGVQPTGQKTTQVSPTSLGKEFKPRQNTEPALWARANELYKAQPTLYRDPNTAYAKALSEYHNEQDILTKTETQFTKSLEKRAQKYGIDIDRDIPGDMWQDYLRQGQALAVSGKESPEKSADKLSTDLLDFAKARSNLNTATIPSLFGLTLSGKEAQSKLQAIRKEYEKADRLELFEDDLVNKTGLSTGVASYLAFPLSANKEINNFAQDSKKKSSLNPFQGTLIKGIQEKGGKGTKKRSEQEVAEFVGKHLKDSDSLNAIATSFNAKGYDPQLILDDIQRQWDSGKLSLNKRQQRDLQKRGRFGATLKDIAYFAGTGLNPQEIVP